MLNPLEIGKVFLKRVMREYDISPYEALDKVIWGWEYMDGDIKRIIPAETNKNVVDWFVKAAEELSNE